MCRGELLKNPANAFLGDPCWDTIKKGAQRGDALLHIPKQNKLIQMVQGGWKRESMSSILDKRITECRSAAPCATTSPAPPWVSLNPRTRDLPWGHASRTSENSPVLAYAAFWDFCGGLTLKYHLRSSHSNMERTASAPF